MDPFVGELTRLYHLASELPIDEFPERAVAQLRDWIKFDGAVFGFGESGDHSLKIGSAVIYNRDPVILRDYAELAQADPVTQRFMLQPGRILNVDTQAVYGAKEHQSVARFSSRYDLRHLLLLGEETSDHCGLRWIVLYRGTRDGFEDGSADRLSAAWGHLLCALELNRLRTLDNYATQDNQRTLALANLSGALEIADPAFLALMRKEWRDHTATRLPHEVVRSMRMGRTFVGRTLEIRFGRRGDYVLCEACVQDPGKHLSPREMQVAEYFATGKSHKEIASLLGNSPNTVRAQLARVYQKLEINDKATLATTLARRHRLGSPE
ncbi:MAG TPA: LuxR C-terminal-related transcriptional regulator [Geothrix sp.]